MEKKFDLIKKILLFLQTYTETRFGSFVVGFLLACTVMYYGVLKNQIVTIESYRAENSNLKFTIDDYRKKLDIVKEEARIEAQREAREYLDYTYSLVKDMRNEVSEKKVKTSKEIQKLEKELKSVRQ